MFFGHARGAGAALNVGAPGHPFTLVETFFAGDPVVVLREDDDDDDPTSCSWLSLATMPSEAPYRLTVTEYLDSADALATVADALSITVSEVGALLESRTNASCVSST